MASLHYLWAKRARFSVASVQFYRAWGKRLFTFPELIKRNRRRQRLAKGGAAIHETAEIGEVVVKGKASRLTVGSFTFLGQVKIDLHDSVIIGNYVCMNDGVEVLTGSHDINDPEWHLVKGKIVIEDYVWIGTGAMILPGVTIGKGAVVGARAVVSKSIPPYSIVVGNPGKLLSKTRTQNLKYNPCEFLAANQAWLKG